MRRWLAGCSLALALAACGSVEVASPEQGAQAKALEPGPQRALIYVFRESGSASSQVTAVVYVRPAAGPDGTEAPKAQTVGLREKTFGVADVPAGSVHLTVVATRGMSTETDNTTLKVAGGSKYYVEVRMGPVLLVRGRVDPRLLIRPEEVGRAALTDSRLIGLLRFGSSGEPPSKS